MNSNLKDTLSTICGILLAICIPVVALITVGTIIVPTVVTGVLVTIIAVSTGLNGYLIGKAPNAALKTDSQVIAGNQK